MRLKTNGQLAEYIPLWQEEKPRDRRDALPAAQTYAPKARVWLRTSQVKLSGGQLGSRDLVGEGWAVQGSPKPAMLAVGWLCFNPAEPAQRFVTGLSVRGAGSADIIRFSWQAVESRREAPGRVESRQPLPSFAVENPGSVRASELRLLRLYGQVLDVWQPEGWSCPPKFERREKRVNPPVRTWIGGLKPSSARPVVATETVPLSPLRTFNSYSRRYNPVPVTTPSETLAYPPAASAIR